MADSATIIWCEHNKGVVIEPGLLQGGHNLGHSHVHVHHHGLVDVPRRVAALWDQVHHLCSGLKWCVGCLGTGNLKLVRFGIFSPGMRGRWRRVGNSHKHWVLFDRPRSWWCPWSGAWRSGCCTLPGNPPWPPPRPPWSRRRPGGRWAGTCSPGRGWSGFGNRGRNQGRCQNLGGLVYSLPHSSLEHHNFKIGLDSSRLWVWGLYKGHCGLASAFFVNDPWHLMYSQSLSFQLKAFSCPSWVLGPLGWASAWWFNNNLLHSDPTPQLNAQCLPLRGLKHCALSSDDEPNLFLPTLSSKSPPPQRRSNTLIKGDS